MTEKEKVILVCEDNSAEMRTVKTQLEKMQAEIDALIGPFVVVEVTTLVDALQAIELHYLNLALVITDGSLTQGPDDGKTIIAKVRAKNAENPSTSKTKIIGRSNDEMPSADFDAPKYEQIGKLTRAIITALTGQTSE